MGKTLKRGVIVLFDVSIPSDATEEDLGLFGYAFTHDLKVSLRPILGLGHYLQSEEVSGARAGEFHNKIVQAATQLERQLDAMAEYTKLCLRVPRREPVDLKRLLRSVVGEELARLRLGEECVELAGRMGSVLADRAILKLVFRELIDNALVFSRLDHPARIKVSCEQKGDRVETTIQDFGLGIPADCLPLLGKPFQRFHPQTPHADGLGLGLTRVTRGLAALGGRLRCSSEVGQGSSFLVCLRVA